MLPKLLDRDFDKLGKYWLKDLEIDIVGVCEDEVIFGECKWKDNVNAKKILSKLEEKVEGLNIKSKNIAYVLFANSFKDKIDEFGGVKVHCFDLKDIESKI